MVLFGRMGGWVGSSVLGGWMGGQQRARGVDGKIIGGWMRG